MSRYPKRSILKHAMSRETSQKSGTVAARRRNSTRIRKRAKPQQMKKAAPKSVLKSKISRAKATIVSKNKKPRVEATKNSGQTKKNVAKSSEQSKHTNGRMKSENVNKNPKEKKEVEYYKLEDIIGLDTSSSSSSDEDSEDDYVQNYGRKLNRRHCSVKPDRIVSDDDSEDEDIKFDPKEERLTKKAEMKMLKRKRKSEKGTEDFRLKEEGDMKDDDIKILPKTRKFKFRPPKTGEPRKRRKLKRNGVDLTEDYVKDTFVEFVEFHDDFLTSIDSDDEVDKDRVEAIIDENIDGLINYPANKNPEDDMSKRLTEIIKADISNKEMDKEMTKAFPINLFAEKLAGFQDFNSIHGNCRPLAQSYHPDMFKSEKLYEIPSFLIWQRPFERLIHQPLVLDIHRNTRMLIDQAVAAKRKKEEDEISNYIDGLAAQKLKAKNPRESKRIVENNDQEFELKQEDEIKQEDDVKHEEVDAYDYDEPKQSLFDSDSESISAQSDIKEDIDLFDDYSPEQIIEERYNWPSVF